jgi:hypothetical protein
MFKTITIDGFYTPQSAEQICSTVYALPSKESEFGLEVPDFNLIPPDTENLFSSVLNIPVKLDEEKSGIFRIPSHFIHFEGFETSKDWIFVVALQQSTFNVFEHKTGIVDARSEHKFNYRNLFEWDLMVNYILKPGQGVFFRPWLFHSFDTGLIQTFRLQGV